MMGYTGCIEGGYRPHLPVEGGVGRTKDRLVSPQTIIKRLLR